jgi:hypothetical protein
MQRQAQTWLSLVVATALVGLSPAPAWAGKRPPKVTVEGAAAARSAAEAEAAGDAQALLDAAEASGDPLLFLAAAKARLADAETPQDAELARDPARVALDILHFVKAGDASGRWQVIPAGDARAYIGEVEELLQEVAAEIERMEEEARAAEAAGDEDVVASEEPERERKPGSGLIAGGSGLLVLGLGGAALGVYELTVSLSAQSDVEAVDPTDLATINRLDEEGERANMLSWVGLAVGVVGVGAGVALLLVGSKKRKAGSGQERAMMITPAPGGLVLSGRF